MKHLLFTAVCLAGISCSQIAGAQEVPTSGFSYGSLDWLWGAAAAAQKKKAAIEAAAEANGAAGRFATTFTVADGDTFPNTRHDRSPASAGGCGQFFCDGDGDGDNGGGGDQ